VSSVTCPFCKKAEVFLPEAADDPLAVCPLCLTEMIAHEVRSLTYRATVKKQRYYLGETAIQPNLRVVLPETISSTDVPTQTVTAIFPFKGIMRKRPVACLVGIKTYFTPHPQTDSQLTKFKNAGMFALLIQTSIWLLTRPPIWMYWVCVAIYMVFYFWIVRSHPSRGRRKQQALDWQNQKKLQCESEVIKDG
jgi:hypothetical protein